MPGYGLDRQGRVQGLVGTVMQQLRGEALGTGSVPMHITDTGSIFCASFQCMVCKLHTDPVDI